MNTFLISLAVISIAVFGMAIGVIISGRRIKGSCGGMNNLMAKQGEASCNICGASYEDQVETGCGKE